MCDILKEQQQVPLPVLAKKFVALNPPTKSKAMMKTRKAGQNTEQAHLKVMVICQGGQDVRSTLVSHCCRNKLPHIQCLYNNIHFLES